ncbi:hypothetical protein POM88_047227 [Heracleum sosnowskyi]|uniref:Uncharacterized protein n=1 Tax=Heracleum sosnowskyi TaxID=360622 RepID=A0AAD8LYI3_9APIA|nr:hypothetical protein POM88_047227 [Heracleum sosnowskyi]
MMQHRVKNEKELSERGATLQITYLRKILDKNDPLPEDWQLFKNAFEAPNTKATADQDREYYEKLSSNPVLLDWQNQINLLMYAYHLNFHSSSQMKSEVKWALRNLDILKVDWDKIVMAEKPWDLVCTHNGATFRYWSVDDLLKFFRNLVAHVMNTTKINICYYYPILMTLILTSHH